MFRLTHGLQLAMLILLVPAAPGAPPPAAPALADRLEKQAEAWDQAIVRKDSLAIAANMAEDFRQIRGSGTVVDKAAFLGGITDPLLVIDPYTVEDFDLRLYGDVALLCGRTRMTGRYDGEPFASHYRYLDIYVRRGDEWRVASVQITPIRD